MGRHCRKEGEKVLGAAIQKMPYYQDVLRKCRRRDIKMPKDRCMQVILSRLRANVNNLAYSRWKRRQHVDGLCKSGKEETVEHILFDEKFKRFEKERTEFLLKIGQYGLSRDVREVVSSVRGLAEASNFIKKTYGEI